MHQGKKITLLSLTPAEILQADRERAVNETKELNVKSENQQPIKLKSSVMLATKSDLAEIFDNDDACYALICTEVLFSLDDVPTSLPPAVTNLLQEYEDMFPAEIPPGCHL
uniref:Uncharacterized protein n=1 Tax=Arundo donax TaxID=35708 RepID=A0A0A9DL57_ARUDO